MEQSRQLLRGRGPPRALHGIVNSGAGTLTYVYCSTPTFSITDLYDTGELTDSPAPDLDWHVEGSANGAEETLRLAPRDLLCLTELAR